ncbi:alpha/beta fold hydrolase [Acidimicrobiaceae bacterium AH-315-P05]|nr:alpha/beta fold hydrolase [Acidimicrobiaceae bacterium AH-315-P05]
MNIDFLEVSRVSDDHGSIELSVAVAGDRAAPLVLFVHGFPETWASWRNQMAHFVGRGFRTAAMDVRGYGASSKPTEIAAYRITELATDAAAVIEHLSPGTPAIIVGHDWGAPIAWQTARLHPDTVRAVAGLSVPYTPASEGDPMELWNLIYADKFFYMKYFQEPGVAEAAFEVDIGAAVRKVYFAASGDAPGDLWLADASDSHAFLDGMVDPDPAPAWMTADVTEPTIAALTNGGTHGAFNRYRAQSLDGQELHLLADPIISQPACFIGGENDIVRHFVPGMDLFEAVDAGLNDFRGKTIIDGAGHWVQQERPVETNAALGDFFTGLG